MKQRDNCYLAIRKVGNNGRPKKVLYVIEVCNDVGNIFKFYEAVKTIQDRNHQMQEKLHETFLDLNRKAKCNAVQSFGGPSLEYVLKNYGLNEPDGFESRDASSPDRICEDRPHWVNLR